MMPGSPADDEFSSKSNCICSHLFIDLASNITLYTNPIPDVRFHCGVTDLMGQEIGEYDFEYEAQIAYIDNLSRRQLISKR